MRGLGQSTGPGSRQLVLLGNPIGSDRIDVNLDKAPRIDMVLQVNNDQDRVGVSALVCPSTNVLFDTEPSTDCDSFIYVFPQLRYDKESRRVYFGDALIAHDRGIWHGGLQLEDGYELQTRIVAHQMDQGFNRYSVRSLEVSLVQTAARSPSQAAL